MGGGDARWVWGTPNPSISDSLTTKLQGASNDRAVVFVRERTSNKVPLDQVSLSLKIVWVPPKLHLLQ